MKKTCLLIDDHPDDQKIFTDALSQVCPQATLLIAPGEGAIKLLRALDSTPEHIFLDINMTMTDGFEFLVKLKREIKFKKSRVIVYSTSNEEKDVEKSKKLGANGFLPKASTLTELCERLRSYFSE